MLSVGAIRFEDRFCASRKGGTGGGGWGHRCGWLCMAAVPCRGSITGLLGSFLSGGAISGRTVLTIERSVMSGCGQGHEPAKNL